ncbi:Helicase C-terminal [Penicillium expansum]|nr:Helicase C-terminal [Penicillium expansum]
MSTNEEASRLRDLQADVRDQDDLERDITRQADKALADKAEENDIKRLEKALVDRERVDSQVRQAQHRLTQPVGAATRHRVENELKRLQVRKADLGKDLKDIQQRIDERRESQGNSTVAHGSGRQPNESRRDYLLRTGKITPFALMQEGSRDGPLANLHDALVDTEDQQYEEEEREQAKHQPTASHRNLARPDFDFDEISEIKSKRRKVDRRSSPGADSEASYVASEADATSEGEEFMPDTLPETKPSRKRKQGKATTELEDLSGVDDGNETVYQSRVQEWISRRSSARQHADSDSVEAGLNEEEEWLKPHPTEPAMELDNGLRVPGDISRFLFPYQKIGVQWLWELHQQTVGGIIGDEMGLGKTIQAISYLAALHHSKKLTKPAIVVCPATLMKQWVNEFHRWWPPFRVSILHSSGSGMINLGKESSRENALSSEMMGSRNSRHLSAGLQSYADALVDVEWGCAILDEGHKIRNPDAGITFSCKELRTPHRIILSGTPMQNSLVDLWSLFDFVFPMRLGNLVTFKNQFEIPIRQGGYASASNLQVQTAAKCAETLKDAISPYLLQRFKADVTSDLPMKSEQVIFCKLTQLQRTIYKRFLGSDDMKSIVRGKRNSLYGIDILRKISNHPDLADHTLRSREADYGDAERSGKMKVLKGLLEVWRDTGHKTLLFTQGRLMLDIIEKFLGVLGGFNYRRMDGTTPIKERQNLVDEFNNNPDIHVLTVSLSTIPIGTHRLTYRRESAHGVWQKRDVTIFRLMTKGTIEEKIYHRQIFKQFLTNKITRDPHQREGFQLSDLYDLFTLTDENDDELETTKLFKNAEVTYQEEAKDVPGSRSIKPAPVPKEEDDITDINGIANVENFQNAAEEEKNAKTSEDRIMHGIFARSGVHSAVQHDQIVNGKRVLRADPKMIEAEARRVANEAAEELRKAEETARALPIGLPTWTGRFGMGGREDPRAGGSSARPAGVGPSSSDLLARLNPAAAAAAGQRASDSDSPSARMPRGKDFMPLIRDYLASQRGPTLSQSIVHHFNHYCSNPQRVAEFQESLKKVATLQHGRDRRGRWTLKPEFARNATNRGR